MGKKASASESGGAQNMLDVQFFQDQQLNQTVNVKFRAFYFFVYGELLAALASFFTTQTREENFDLDLNPEENEAKFNEAASRQGMQRALHNIG